MIRQDGLIPSFASNPGEWTVVLKDGCVLEVVAHGYGESDGHHCFVLVMEGDPPIEIVVARVPTGAILSVAGG